MKIYITKNTVLKTSTKQSLELTDAEKVDVKAGTELDISAYLEEDNHIKFTIADRIYDIAGRNTWYCFKDHCRVENNRTQTSTNPNPNKGKALSLPGYNNPFYLNDPIYPNSNFTWSEATKNGTRLPYEKTQVDNIIAVAKKMDLIRSYLGDKPIIITSWLRPDKPVDINRMVGGARNSKHITGEAVDFTVPSINMMNAQKRMDSFCREHNLGLGLGVAKGNFIHIDLAGYRVWNY